MLNLTLSKGSTFIRDLLVSFPFKKKNTKLCELQECQRNWGLLQSKINYEHHHTKSPSCFQRACVCVHLPIWIFQLNVQQCLIPAIWPRSFLPAVGVEFYQHSVIWGTFSFGRRNTSNNT